MPNQSVVTVPSSSCDQMARHVELCVRDWDFPRVKVKACISSWACEYARAWVPSLNAQLFPPKARVCGSEHCSVCASMLICKLNADLSIKADLARILPTNMPVITTLFHSSPKGTEQPLGQVDGDTHAHTKFKPDWYEGANVREGGAWGSCNHPE